MTTTPPDLIPLGIADIRLTRLCFGTGTLFRLHSSRERQRLLDVAHDLGIRHFDMPATPVRVWQAIQGAKQNG